MLPVLHNNHNNSMREMKFVILMYIHTTYNVYNMLFGSNLLLLYTSKLNSHKVSTNICKQYMHLYYVFLRLQLQWMQTYIYIAHNRPIEKFIHEGIMSQSAQQYRENKLRKKCIELQQVQVTHL